MIDRSLTLCTVRAKYISAVCLNYQLYSIILLRRVRARLLVPRPIVPRVLVHATGWTSALRITPHIYAATGWLLDSVDQAIQDDEFNLQLDTIDTWFEGPLQVEQIGALNSEERDVKRNNESIRVYKLP